MILFSRYQTQRDKSVRVILLDFEQETGKRISRERFYCRLNAYLKVSPRRPPKEEGAEGRETLDSSPARVSEQGSPDRPDLTPVAAVVQGA